MKTISLLVFVFLLPILCLGQEGVVIPPEFIETNQPKTGSSDWTLLNSSKYEFAVSIVDGKLQIWNPYQSCSSSASEDCSCKLKIKDGTLKGNNWGEWGGQLYYEPDNINKLNIKIKKGNIKFIFECNDKIYFIEGLAHMMMNQGALFELSRLKKRFTYKKIYDFEDSPEAFVFFKNKLLIAGNENFYVLENLKKELVFQKMFWDGLYPNSVTALDEKNVFIGIRSGIVRLDLVEKKATFYKYNK
jgi:hypothetical protein